MSSFSQVVASVGSNGAAEVAAPPVNRINAAANAAVMDRAAFRRGASLIPVTGEGGGPVTLEPKAFSTGNIGWFYNGKTTVQVGGVAVRCQCQVSAVIIAKYRPNGLTVDGLKPYVLPDYIRVATKHFSTGSVGWHLSGKDRITSGDDSYSVQLGITITAIGSKEWA